MTNFFLCGQRYVQGVNSWTAAFLPIYGFLQLQRAPASSKNYTRNHQSLLMSAFQWLCCTAPNVLIRTRGRTFRPQLLSALTVFFFFFLIDRKVNVLALSWLPNDDDDTIWLPVHFVRSSFTEKKLNWINPAIVSAPTLETDRKWNQCFK